MEAKIEDALNVSGVNGMEIESGRSLIRSGAVVGVSFRIKQSK